MLEREQEIGGRLVERAAELLRGGHRGLATEKARFDLVTETDEASEALIVAGLRDAFPDDAIVGEEGGGTTSVAPVEGRCWVIDPLDGTVNFANSVPFYAVSVALLVDGEPALGWVSDPLRDEVFHAVAGGGAWLGERRLRKMASPPVAALGGSSDIVGAPVSGVLAERFGKVRVLGSQALQLCYVACGRLWGTVNGAARLWDDAAGALIVSEVGGSYGDFEGEALFPLERDDAPARGAAFGSAAAVDPERFRELISALADGRLTTGD